MVYDDENFRTFTVKCTDEAWIYHIFKNVIYFIIKHKSFVSYTLIQKFSLNWKQQKELKLQ